MPLYMDVHKNQKDIDLKAAAEAHMKDLQTQGKYGVKYLKYWVDQKEGSIFCLVDAPNKEAANNVHREAHGGVADEIHEVEEGQ